MGARGPLTTLVLVGAMSVAASVAPGWRVDAATGDPAIPTEGEVPQGAPPTAASSPSGPTESGNEGNDTNGGNDGNTARPTPTTVLPTNVVKKEVAVPPVIHCAWLTADMDPATDGIQRQVGGLADDLPDVPRPTPCSLDPTSGVPLMVPTDDPVASIRPNSGDEPGTRTIEAWVAISHATGPASIDGVEFTIADESEATPTIGSTSLVAIDPAGSQFDAGVTSGQIGTATRDGLDELLADGWAVVAGATLTLSYLDGCGLVALDVTTTAAGQPSVARVPFDVICYHHLSADFETIDWGGLVPDAESVVPGDLDLATADRPTIVNIGNRPLVVSTTFEPLCSTASPPVCIGEFGVEMTPAETTTIRLGPSPSGTELAAEMAICPGVIARLDAIVQTPANAQPGDYNGSMRMVGVGAPDAVCDSASPDAPPPATTEPSAETTEPPATTEPSAETTEPPATTEPTEPPATTEPSAETTEPPTSPPASAPGE